MQPATQQNPMMRLVREVMHDGILTCDRDASLADVARTMAEERVHCVVVESGSGDTGPLWGIVSDLDLVAAASVRRLEDQTAGGSAASPIVMIPAGETLERAAQLMTEHGTSHVVVVDGAMRPAGVLSTLDIADALSAEAAG
jgi:CBS domain-containing protein